MAKPIPIKILQWLHLTIVGIAVSVISLLHFYPVNFLDFLRVPLFLKEINSLLGFGWSASLHVYQIILVFFLFITLVDGLGLLFYHSKIWRLISDLSSFLGFLIIWPAGLFFIFVLASAETLKSQSVQTALFYFLISLFLFILDLITWFVDEKAILVRKLTRIRHKRE